MSLIHDPAPADAGANTPHIPQQHHWSEWLVHRLHTWIGLLVGPFMLVAVFTGLFYVWTPQIEAWAHRDLLRSGSAGEPVSLEQQIAIARRHLGAALPLSGVRPAPEPGGTTRVLFSDKSLGEGERVAVFIDPVQGRVLGQSHVYGTSGALPLRTWSSKLHRQLLQGENGRIYSELAASWLWVAALGGLFLWAVKRTRRQATARRLPRKPLRDRHAHWGLWLLAGLLFLSASGLTWSRFAGENISQMRKAWGWGTPSLRTTLPGAGSPAISPEHSDHSHGDAPPAMPVASGLASFDQVLAAARAYGIDAARLEIRAPATPEKAWTVTEIDRRWPTQVDAVAVDGQSLQVVDAIRFETFPMAAKLTRWAVDLHMGVMFGVPNQLALTAVGAGLALMIAWGYTMWWRRRAQAQPTLWQALARASWPARLAMAAVAVALGWSLPVLGVSLLVFLVLDAEPVWRPAIALKGPAVQEPR
ncbi:MAG: PepSY-associated TM helix domain-containing protein [Burkholderiaceae bacterium]